MSRRLSCRALHTIPNATESQVGVSMVCGETGFRGRKDCLPHGHERLHQCIEHLCVTKTSLLWWQTSAAAGLQTCMLHETTHPINTQSNTNPRSPTSQMVIPETQRGKAPSTLQCTLRPSHKEGCKEGASQRIEFPGSWRGL